MKNHDPAAGPRRLLRALASDRFWTLKLAAAALLFSWLCIRAHKDLTALHPDAEICVKDPLRSKGRTVRTKVAPVLAAGDGWYDVSTNVGSLRVTSALSPAVGEHVEAVAVVTGFRALAAVRDRVNPGYAWKRKAMYAVSVAVVAIFLWAVRRRFRWRPSEGLFRGRY